MTRLRAQDAKKRQTSGQGRDFLEVLARSISVIDALGGGKHALTLSDVARATDLPKPSVRRVLHTLCALGYAEMAGRNFKLTPKIVRLATAYLGTSGNSRVLQSACEHLSEATGQSCLAGVLDGADVLVVAYTIPRELLGTSLGVGVHFPAFCTAAGRVLLGQMPDDDLDAFLKKLRPVAQTEFTITDKVRIRAEIIAARKRGYAWMEDEFTLGWKTIAYPLKRHDGSVFGTLSLNSKKAPGLTEAQFKKFNELCAAQANALGPLLV
jgi:IclR family pca regulon transcriptional regulator